MKSSNHWKFLLALVPIIGTLVGCAPCQAQTSARIVQTNDLDQVARGPGKPISFFQAASLDIDVQIPGGLPTAGATATFEVWKTPDQWLIALTNAVIGPSSVVFRASVDDTSIPGGAYRYTARLFAPSATTGAVDIAVLAHGSVNVLTTPYGAIPGNPPTNGIRITIETTVYEGGGGDLTSLSNAVAALQNAVPAKADSNTVWATFAKTSDLPAPYDPAALQSNIAAEASTRAAADSTLQSNINAVATSIPDVSGFAASTTLTAEATSRISGDALLQSNINAVAASILDVVGIGTDTTARAWAQAGSNTAAAAFAWGDHAAAGYASTGDVVTLAGTQTITGAKTFIGRTKFKPSGEFWISSAGSAGDSRFGLSRLGGGGEPDTWFGLKSPGVLAKYPSETSTTANDVFAYLSQVQKQNAIGATTNMPIAALTQTSSNTWSGGGWSVKGQVTNGVITLTGTGDYIDIPAQVLGVARIAFGSLYGNGSHAYAIDLYSQQASLWTSNHIEKGIYTGLNEADLAISASTNGPSMRLRYGAVIIPDVEGIAGLLAITNLTLITWSIGDYVGSTNDAAGMVSLVDDNIANLPRAAVNQRTLDDARTEARIGREAINPSLVGVDLNYHELRFNHLWRARQTNETLRFTFDSHTMFQMTGGGTVTPVVVNFGLNGTTASVTVASATAWRPWLQYSTNLYTGWENAVTNAYASTWPTLLDGTYTLTYTSIYPTAYYRVIATTTNNLAVNGEAIFNVPIVGSASRMHSFPSTLLTVSAFQTSPAMTNTLLRVPPAGRTNVLVLIDGAGNITTQRILQVIVQ